MTSIKTLRLVGMILYNMDPECEALIRITREDERPFVGGSSGEFFDAFPDTDLYGEIHLESHGS